MSKNNKNAQRIRQAREMSALRKSGGKGPSRTTPKHGKKNAWWQVYRSYSEYIKGKGNRKSNNNFVDTTSEEEVVVETTVLS